MEIRPRFLIGAGIGVTPMMAILNYILKADSDKLPKPLELHIIQRKKEEAQPCFDLIKQITKDKEKSISAINVYLTRENSSIKKLSSYNFGLFAEKMQIHEGRPDLEKIIKSKKHVSVCGSDQLVKSASSVASRFGARCYMDAF